MYWPSPEVPRWWTAARMAMAAYNPAARSTIATPTLEGGPSTGNTPAEVLAALYLKVTSARAIDPVAAAIPVNARRVEVLPAPESNNEDKE